MIVYVLLNTWNTPANEGAEIVGVWACKEDAQAKMREEAQNLRKEFPTDFWTEDMTWEDDDEIHLGYDPMTLELATIYDWTICKSEIM